MKRLILAAALSGAPMVAMAQADDDHMATCALAGEMAQVQLMGIVSMLGTTQAYSGAARSAAGDVGDPVSAEYATAAEDHYQAIEGLAETMSESLTEKLNAIRESCY